MKPQRKTLPILPIDYLHECLEYDASTGAMSWRERPVWHFKNAQAMRCWNGRYAGPITSVCNDGYIRVQVHNRPYRCHRIAWAFTYGDWPEWHIDHINGIRNDNRIENLREVTIGENSLNKKVYRHSSTGISGVNWDEKLGKWRAHITLKNQRHYLGLFTDVNAAADARKAAEKRLGFHDNHGRQQ